MDHRVLRTSSSTPLCKAWRTGACCASQPLTCQRCVAPTSTYARLCYHHLYPTHSHTQRSQHDRCVPPFSHRMVLPQLTCCCFFAYCCVWLLFLSCWVLVVRVDFPHVRLPLPSTVVPWSRPSAAMRWRCAQYWRWFLATPRCTVESLSP